MELMEAIKTRRSIRKFKPTPVADKDLETVLEAARWAPSWTNCQCTRYIVVKDAATREQIANEAVMSVNPAHNAIKQAPVVLVLCSLLGRSGTIKGNVTTDKGDWFMFDTALASQNLTLAAHSLGLGTVHVGDFNAPQVAKILDVPEGSAVVELMPLGYPESEGKPSKRKELSEIVFYGSYGKTEA